MLVQYIRATKRARPFTRHEMKHMTYTPAAASAAPLNLRREQPEDCGKLVVCKGTAGAQWWLKHDPAVFDPYWEMGGPQRG